MNIIATHDEVVHGGPEEKAEEAFEEVISCMETPWVPGLERAAIPLLVNDSYVHKTWHEAN